MALLTHDTFEGGESPLDDEEESLPPPSRSELSAEELKEYLEHLRPEDFGKFNP